MTGFAVAVPERSTDCSLLQPLSALHNAALVYGHTNQRSQSNAGFIQDDQADFSTP
jgi:hypothetical protein